jgi:hypothetical protein
MNNRDLRMISVSVIVAAAVTWAAATSDYSPIKPKPASDRPILRLVQRLARLGLWVMWAADPPPTEEFYVVHARVDEDGNRIINHGRGW